MRHGKKVKKLGRKKAHRRALLKNLCRALFIFERIRTTLVKAKETRKMAERIIETAKPNDLAAKRHIYRLIPDHKLVSIITTEIAPKFKDTKGGYTRIYRLGPRMGDGAEMAILELIALSDETTITNRRKLIERRHLPAEKAKKEKEKKEPAGKPVPKKSGEKDKEKPKKEKTKKEEPKKEDRKKLKKK